MGTEDNGAITVITRLRVGHSDFGITATAIAGGPYENAKGLLFESVMGTIQPRQSCIVWLWNFTFPFILVAWPVRVTNLGKGAYRVSRPWPWLFGENEDDTRQATQPKSVESQTTLTAVLA